MGAPVTSDLHIEEVTDAPGSASAHAIMLAAFAALDSGPYPSSALGETLAHTRAWLSDTSGLVLGRLVTDTVPASELQAAMASGEAVASVRFRHETAHGTLYLERLGVLPAYRGYGYGAAMVAWLEGLARKRGASKLSCTARSCYPDNRPFWLSLGFSVTGYSERYGVPHIRTHLVKTISATAI